ncbi:winged helix-turn-helix domain-containing protein [Mesorhizobium xinjiangense]|uniref:winged helix-turn-helix domain-containing protein n=1 Tax=Mesorhizobium xinjiangense TaxID=2678685 RepID=UPI0012EEC624|nr:winged helix-turn-helix domain-containing protein [Mesorhizobium xinjiangense]
MRDSISLATARRIALASQGFADSRPQSAVTQRHLGKVIGRTGLLQIDSVSAVVRAHYMPIFSRLGAYPMHLLDNAASKRQRRLFEYWAHEASFLPVETWPLMQWRMAKAGRNERIYRRLAEFGRDHQAYIEEIHRLVEREGPIAASDIDGQRGQGGWWGWSDAKHAFEWLFWAGRITTHSRRGFERLYDIPERVLPGRVLDTPTPDEADAIRELLRIAARALGVATAADLRDYFRLNPVEADERIAELVEAGELQPVRVEGWSQKAWMWKDARKPRKVDAQALLAPFDPLVWERGRTERLFGFRYRIEIYTPAEKRVHGYYVLPFLLGDRLVARVDLKADRRAGTLRVMAAHCESGAPPETAQALADELALMACWLGMEGIEVLPKGDFAPELAGACRHVDVGERLALLPST